MTELFLYGFVLAWTVVTIMAIIDKRERKKNSEDLIKLCKNIEEGNKETKEELEKVNKELKAELDKVSKKVDESNKRQY